MEKREHAATRLFLAASRKKFPDIVDVIVEVPKGCRNNYEYDRESGRIKLDRVLFSSVHYPADYGYVEGPH